MRDQMRDDLRLAAAIVREEKQFDVAEGERSDESLDRIAATLERLADMTEMPAQFRVVTITPPDGAAFDVWIRNLHEAHAPISALLEVAGWSAYSTETEAPRADEIPSDQPSDFELVLDAAERRARELLDQASKLTGQFADETLREHYQPLRRAIDAFRDDSVGAELSRMETDVLEIHDALVDAGLEGAINASSIIARIKLLAASTTPNGYDGLWVRAINRVLADRETGIVLSDLTDALWEKYIGPLVDAIERAAQTPSEE